MDVVARELEATLSSLDHRCARAARDHSIDLRWLMLHMIEEYARYNGHAGVIREVVYGAVGE